MCWKKKGKIKSMAANMTVMATSLNIKPFALTASFHVSTFVLFSLIKDNMLRYICSVGKTPLWHFPGLQRCN
jgi:hypothetical protein